MPPHLRSTNSAGEHDWALSILPGYLFKFLQLLALLVTITTSLILLRSRGKASMKDFRPSSDHEINRALPVSKKKDLGTAADKAMTSLWPYPQIHANQYLQSLRQEALHPSLIPVYPWVAPPSPLPGPYDAPYYPLPLPTIRNQQPEQLYSVDTTSSANPLPHESKNEVLSNESETLLTKSYIRRLSDNARLPYDPVLEGSTTVSSAGWRRTQWSVSAG